MRHLIVYILVLVLLSSCGQDSSNKLIASQSKQTNSDTLTHFKHFLDKFKMLSLPFIANTSCYEPDKNLSVKFDLDNNSLFVKSPGVSVGMFSDTTSYYALIYCGEAACYMPILAVFSKEGKQLSEEEISHGCGSDCGYSCLDSLIINSMSDMTLMYIKESYTCDSVGKETPGTWEKTVDISKYSINKLGKIKKTSTHTSQKR